MLGAVINLAIIEFIALSLPDSGHKDYPFSFSFAIILPLVPLLDLVQ